MQVKLAIKFVSRKINSSTAEMISGSHPTLYKLYISNLTNLTKENNMNIGTLAVTCDHIERVSPTGVNDNRLTILLDDVSADLLMQQLVMLLPREELLDYFKDSDIVEYFKAREAVTLSPREQYAAKLDESKCYDYE